MGRSIQSSLALPSSRPPKQRHNTTFAEKMKYTAIVAATGLAALASAQDGYTYNENNGTVYGASGAGFGNITFPTNSSEAACSNAASNGGSSGTTSMAPYMNGTSTAGSGSGAMGTAAPSGGYGSGSGSGSSGNNTSGTTPYTGGVSGLQATGTFAGLGALFVAMGLI